MIIDDTYADRFIAERIIKKNNFAEEVIMMDSATTALDYLKAAEEKPQEIPQLIFLDIRISMLDGFGFLEEYAKLPERIKSNCIVLLSTLRKPDDDKKAKLNPYVITVLDKPLDKEKLDALLSAAAE